MDLKALINLEMQKKEEVQFQTAKNLRKLE